METISLTKLNLDDLLNNYLIPQWVKFLHKNENDAITNLNESLNLEDLPSTDSRFDNAYEDLIQHFIRNNDWDIDYLFKERLKLQSNQQLLQKFLLGLLNSQLFDTYDEQNIFALDVDGLLKKDKFCLVVKVLDNNFDVFDITNYEHKKSYPFGVIQNSITFFINKEFDGTLEYFNLVPNSWDDFGIKSTFNLSYHDKGSSIVIGQLKIIHKSENDTKNFIPPNFLELPEEFCSLGQHIEYYHTLFNLKDRRFFDSITYALRDVAIYGTISEEFDNKYNFKKSLIRGDISERLYREVRHQIHGHEISNFYNFTYLFHPPYSTDKIEIPINFLTNKNEKDRIISIIGKNAVGKTKLLSNLPIDISRSKKENFVENKIPSYSKIIAVSFSAFDNFDIPKKNDLFNYVYCGLRDESDNKNSKTIRALRLKFHIDLKKIIINDRFYQWRSAVSKFIDEDILVQFAPLFGITPESQYSAESFSKISHYLSSGQAIILYVITSILSEIKFDSLLIFDEPETHLHPNAIVNLINMIYQITEEFQSYAVIATHSPFIIRELFSRNVWVLEREHNVASLRRIGIESFGSDLSTISNEIFRDREVTKTYSKIINDLKDKRLSKEEVVEYLKSGNMPLSLEARMEVESIFSSK